MHSYCPTTFRSHYLYKKWFMGEIYLLVKTSRCDIYQNCLYFGYMPLKMKENMFYEHIYCSTTFRNHLAYEIKVFMG